MTSSRHSRTALAAAVSQAVFCFCALTMHSNRASAQESTEVYKLQTMTPYVEDVKSEMVDVRSEVEDELQSWVDDTEMGGLWMYGNPARDAFLELDSEWIQDSATLACNLADPGFTTHAHSYDDLQTFPTIALEAGKHPAGKICDINIFWKYEPDDSGYPAGECLNIYPIELIFFRIYICEWAHVVDYYYPTTKFNFSNQLFYSRYLSTLDVAEVGVLLREALELTNGFWTATSLIQFYLIAKVIPKNFDLAANYSNAENVDLWDTPWEAWRRSINAGRGLILPEEDALDDYKWYIHPHEDRDVPEFSTDADSPMMFYWIGNSAVRDRSMYADFLLDPVTPCVRNNMETGKTPDWPRRMESLTRPMSPKGTHNGDLTGDIGRVTIEGRTRFNRTKNDPLPCVGNVGPVFPFNKHRYPHTSDGFFQQFVKTFQDYYLDHADDAYTFKQEKDRLHFLPELLHGDDLQMNDQFGEAVVGDDILGKLNCPIFNRVDDETLGPEEYYETYATIDNDQGQKRVNMDYLEANKAVPDSQEETTAEIFTAFSGCWHWYPQWESDFPQTWQITWRYIPSIHKMTPFGIKRRLK